MTRTETEKPHLLKAMAVFILLWFGVGLLLSYLVNGSTYESLKLYYISAAYYVIAAGFGVYYYKVKSVMDHHEPFRRQLLLIAALYAVSLVAGLWLSSHYPISEERQQQIIATRIFFPLWTVETWSMKLAEIIFQQAFIFSILTYINRIYEYSKSKKIVVFALTFALIHVPLLLFFGWRGLYFILPSIFAGFIFSYLILTYRLGLVYSFIVHVGFYFVFGSVMRYIVI